MKTTKDILGMDSSKEALAILNKYNINNVIWGDATKLSSYLPSEYKNPDRIIYADIIEHIANVGDLISEICNCMGQNTSFIISTINAYSGKVFFRALLGREAVHPDHIAYYSYVTAKYIIKKFNLKIVDFKWFSYGESKIFSKIFFKLLRTISPPLNDGFILVCRKK